MDLLTEIQGNNLIKNMIRHPLPLMISRMGKVEAECVYAFMEGGFFTSHHKYQAQNNAGIFPAKDEILNEFCIRYISSLKDADIMASWLPGLDDEIIDKHNPNTIRVPLRSLEPYYHETPWSSSLKGKRVLIIHPFSESISNQYKKRCLLFKNENILPEFELITLKAVQSSAGNKTPYNTWFDALVSMYEMIDKEKFDIAIIGAGSYGLPLASFIKKIGKISIHMAGATQILFGIKGKRWDEHDIISKLYNENWVRPLPEETPANFLNIENGCYW